MNDLAKGVLGGGWSLLVGWFLPTSINVAIFSILILPSLQDRSFDAHGIKAIANNPWVFIVAVVAIGILLNSLHRPLYRILEGYLFWPKCLYELAVKRQRTRVSNIEKEIKEATSEIQQALSREKRNTYPIDVDNQLCPTRLGNAIRRFEEYAFNRFTLDSQTLWYELSVTAPPQVSRQGEIARSSVDFFVSLIYGHTLLALISIGAWLAGDPNAVILILTTVLALALSRVWYLVAVQSCREWAATQQALVNLSRKPLAEALGLRLPDTMGDERNMWTALTLFIQDPYGAAGTSFDQFRALPDEDKMHELPEGAKRHEEPEHEDAQQALQEE